MLSLAKLQRVGKSDRFPHLGAIMGEPVGVTIVVVNYNYERFLVAAIDSALNQNHPHCEVIAVDDCSTDSSVAAIAGYGDRIRSVLRKTNGGQVEALNSAWPLARYPIPDLSGLG
jgi:glycosyltransferase involved in cell wall biosynthesis